MSTAALGVDYGWGRPRPQTLVAAGYEFVARYLSRDPTKSLTAVEADALAAAGIWIVAVFEDSANRSLGDFVAGQADGTWASGIMRGCGAPAGAPVYWAVDFDALVAQEAAILRYIHAAAEASGHPAGAYGDDQVCAWAAASGIPYRWQTCAWSAGRLSPAVHLYQRPGQTDIDGVSVDVDQALAVDFGQWKPGATNRPTEEADFVNDSERGAIVRLAHLATFGTEPSPEQYGIGKLTIAQTNDPDAFVASIADSPAGVAARAARLEQAG